MYIWYIHGITSEVINGRIDEAGLNDGSYVRYDDAQFKSGVYMYVVRTQLATYRNKS